MFDKTCSTVLIPALNDPQLTTLSAIELADWLLDKIHNAKINLNPKGSFMRRTLFIVEMLHDKHYNMSNMSANATAVETSPLLHS